MKIFKKRKRKPILTDKDKDALFFIKNLDKGLYETYTIYTDDNTLYVLDQLRKYYVHKHPIIKKERNEDFCLFTIMFNIYMSIREEEHNKDLISLIEESLEDDMLSVGKTPEEKLIIRLYFYIILIINKKLKQNGTNYWQKNLQYKNSYTNS